MSRKGGSPDNTRAEGSLGLLKQGFFHPRDWRGAGQLDYFMCEHDRRMHWFRWGRRSEALGWRIPDESRRLLGYAESSVRENINNTTYRLEAMILE